jgi:hypothetical protein
MRATIHSSSRSTRRLAGTAAIAVTLSASTVALADTPCDEIGKEYTRKGPTYSADAAWDDKTEIEVPPWQLNPGEIVIDYQDVRYFDIGHTWMNVGYVSAGGVFAGASDVAVEYEGAIDLAGAYADVDFKAHLEQKRKNHTSIVSQYASNRNTIVVIVGAEGNHNPFDQKKGDIEGHLVLTIKCVGTKETVQQSSELALTEVIARPSAANLSEPERETHLTAYTPGDHAQQWFIVPVATGEPDQFMIINRETGQPLDYADYDESMDRLIMFPRVAIFAPAQRWKIDWQDAEHELARFTNVHTGKAIDFIGFDLDQPPGMLIDVVEGAPAQKWYVDRRSGGAAVLRNSYNDKVLTFP